MHNYYYFSYNAHTQATQGVLSTIFLHRILRILCDISIYSTIDVLNFMQFMLRIVGKLLYKSCKETNIFVAELLEKHYTLSNIIKATTLAKKREERDPTFQCYAAVFIRTCLYYNHKVR